MKRLLIVLAAASVLLAACGGESPETVNATVNGVEITTGDVEGLIYEVQDADRDPARYAGYLGVLIQWEAIRQAALAEYGFEPTDEAIDAEVREFVLAQNFFELETYLAAQNISEAGLRQLVGQILIEQHLHNTFASQATASLDDAQAAFDEAPAEYTEVCASHILVETAEEAEAARERLDAGEDFALLAAELSIDTSNASVGGYLGCAVAAGYVAEFADAALAAEFDEVVGPVETQFGHHLIIVESRTETPLEEIRQSLVDDEAFAAVEEWLDQAVRNAQITVDESKGSWVLDPTPQVVPPPVLG
jgi:parvulin-like peptidyl-prolyl isomerase